MYLTSQKGRTNANIQYGSNIEVQYVVHWVPDIWSSDIWSFWQHFGYLVIWKTFSLNEISDLWSFQLYGQFYQDKTVDHISGTECNFKCWHWCREISRQHWITSQMSVSTDSGAPLHEEDGYLIPSLSPLPEGSAEAEEEEEASEDTSRGVMTPTPESESESDFHNFSEIFDSDSNSDSSKN